MFKWWGTCTWPASASVLGATLEIPLLQTDDCSIFLCAAPLSCCQIWFLGCWQALLLPVLLSDLLLQQQPAPALPQAVKSQERSEGSSADCCQGEESGKEGEGKPLPCQQTRQGCWKHSTACRGQEPQPPAPTWQRNRE